MLRKSKKILLVGLFLSKSNKSKIYRTAADQLKEIFIDNEIPLICTSNKVNKILRAFDIIGTIIIHTFSYNIAVTPYYGSQQSIMIEKWSSILLKILGKKVILIVHGGRLPDLMRKNSKKYTAIFKYTDVIVCPSRFLQHEIAIYNYQSIVIENVLKLSDYEHNVKTKFNPNILWMRTFQDVYHPFMAIEMLKILKEKLPHAKMKMAGGDKGLLEPTKNLALKLGLLNDVEFLGYITNFEKNDIAKQFDFYICTNRIDNAPVSLVEMMRLGLIIVTVNSGGIPYMISNNENGLLVNFDDANAMANKIIEIVENPAIGQVIANNALNTASCYDALPIVEKWKKLFHTIEHL